MQTIKKISISVVTTNVLIICLSLLLFGFIITQTVEVKVHYFIFILATIFLAFINIKNFKLPTKLKSIYVFLTLFLCFSTLPKVGLSPGFLFSIVSYLLVPLVFYSNAFSGFNINKLFVVFKIVNVVFAIGLLLQILGIESKYLDKQFTYTLGELEFRLGSFAGGPLLLGLSGCILIIFALFELKKKLKNAYIYICVGLFNLVISQSRRFYIFILLTSAVMLLFQYNKTNKKAILKKLLFFSFSIAVIFVAAFVFFNDNYYVTRFVSVFDFKNDSSNSLRIVMWLKAINDFLNNLWLGTGLSSTTIVGKDIWSIVDSVEDVVTTESFYLKNFVEGGVFFGLFWFYLLSANLVKAFKAFKFNNNSNKALAGYFILFFFIDSFVSTSLESILSSTLFWISVSVLNKKPSLN